MVDYADVEGSSEMERDTEIATEVEILGLELPSATTCSTSIGGCMATSSQSHVKSYFVGMGFSPTLVDKALKENGDDNADLILEALFTYSAINQSSPEPPVLLEEIHGNCKIGSSSAALAICGPEIKAIEKPSYESSDSLDELFGDCMNETSSSKFATNGLGIKEDMRASLLMMNFSAQEVDLALSRLGDDAPLNELVDFILADQIAHTSGRDTNDLSHDGDRKDQNNATEVLFHSMDKTLRLLEMGFTDNEVSSAIEKYGSETPVGELADSIFANRIADTCFDDDKDPSALHWGHRSHGVHQLHDENEQKCLQSPREEHNKRPFFDLLNIKTEPSISSDYPIREDMDFQRILRGKKPKHEYEDYADSFPGTSLPQAMFGPKSCMPTYKELHQMPEGLSDALKIPQQLNSNQCRNIPGSIAKPPYFFYGNVLDVTNATWTKLSQFMYAVSPEFVNTQFFSALSRKEGYIHNLPTDNRFHILPKPAMTIEDALPHTKKWWPSWDNRKQLSNISSATMASSQLCDRLGKILRDSNGMLPKEQQLDLLHQCKTSNLVWVDQYQLSPIEPEQLELILGYPVRHTEVVRWDLEERFRLLKYCFQTDTLGYHLSVLKHIFPNGLTVLSLYTGIGGAEVALHRLGVHLKGVVSVESSQTNQRILRAWWQSTGQSGELVQIEDINKLTSNKLSSLLKRLGGFDLVICENSCTTGSSKTLHRENPIELDTQMFFEFVRVLHCTRSATGNR